MALLSITARGRTNLLTSAVESHLDCHYHHLLQLIEGVHYQTYTPRSPTPQEGKNHRNHHHRLPSQSHPRYHQPMQIMLAATTVTIDSIHPQTNSNPVVLHRRMISKQQTTNKHPSINYHIGYPSLPRRIGNPPSTTVQLDHLNISRRLFDLQQSHVSIRQMSRQPMINVSLSKH